MDFTPPEADVLGVTTGGAAPLDGAVPAGAAGGDGCEVGVVAEPVGEVELEGDADVEPGDGVEAEAGVEPVDGVEPEAGVEPADGGELADDVWPETEPEEPTEPDDEVDSVEGAEPDEGVELVGVIGLDGVVEPVGVVGLGDVVEPDGDVEPEGAVEPEGVVEPDGDVVPEGVLEPDDGVVFKPEQEHGWVALEADDSELAHIDGPELDSDLDPWNPDALGHGELCPDSDDKVEDPEPLVADEPEHEDDP